MKGNGGLVKQSITPLVGTSNRGHSCLLGRKKSLEKGWGGSVHVAMGDVFSVGYKIFPATRVTAIRCRLGRRLFLETSSPEKLGSSRN